MSTFQKFMLTVACLLLWCAVPVSAQDWLQWRGNSRDGIATNFESPGQWPKELVKKWTVKVGNGVASPSVFGNKIYVMAMQDGNEVMRCLNAETGEEIWKDQYAARAASGPAAGFAGTRSSPAIGEGSVATLGVDGTVSCWDAESGKLIWRNDDNLGKVPRFSTSSSPLIADGLCIVQFGTDREGGVVAYDLKTGKENWKWTQNGSSYGSPVLMTVGEHKVVIAPSANQLVAVSLADGKSLWSMDYTQGRYNAATPVVDGQTVIVAGPNRGMTALELSADGDKIISKEKWRNEDAETTVMYNTPVLLNGNLFGLSNANQLFCVQADSGKKTWNQPMSPTDPAAPQPTPGHGEQGGNADRGDRGGNQQGNSGERPRGGGQRGGRGGGQGGYGSIVSAGSALIGLTPSSELVVYQPSGDEFKELARYKVSQSRTFAYPIPVGNQIYIKDEDSLTMWGLK
jgi:outer membrane protein assembly factor BamB